MLEDQDQNFLEFQKHTHKTKMHLPRPPPNQTQCEGPLSCAFPQGHLCSVQPECSGPTIKRAAFRWRPVPPPAAAPWPQLSRQVPPGPCMACLASPDSTWGHGATAACATFLTSAVLHPTLSSVSGGGGVLQKSHPAPQPPGGGSQPDPHSLPAPSTASPWPSLSLDRPRAMVSKCWLNKQSVFVPSDFYITVHSFP